MSEEKRFSSCFHGALLSLHTSQASNHYLAGFAIGKERNKLESYLELAFLWMAVGPDAHCFPRLGVDFGLSVTSNQLRNVEEKGAILPFSTPEWKPMTWQGRDKNVNASLVWLRFVTIYNFSWLQIRKGFLPRTLWRINWFRFLIKVWIQNLFGKTTEKMAFCIS